MSCKNAHLGHFLDFLDVSRASRSTVPKRNEQTDAPKYTEQDLKNAKDEAINDLKRKIRDTQSNAPSAKISPAKDKSCSAKMGT